MYLPERYHEIGRHIVSSRFRRLSHTIYECKYYIVFCPKYLFRIFKDEIAEYTKQQVYIFCRQKESVEIMELNVQVDHIHLVMSIAPKYAVSYLMGYVKGKLSLRLFQRYEKIGKRYWGRHLWVRGFCVSTVGLTEEQIRQYVKWKKSERRRLRRSN